MFGAALIALPFTALGIRDLRRWEQWDGLVLDEGHERALDRRIAEVSAVAVSSHDRGHLREPVTKLSAGHHTWADRLMQRGKIACLSVRIASGPFARWPTTPARWYNPPDDPGRGR